MWTDPEWGGSHVTVPAGATLDIVVTYDNNTERGAVADLIFFVDSGRGDGETYSSDVTLSNFCFSYVE